MKPQRILLFLWRQLMIDVGNGLIDKTRKAKMAHIGKCGFKDAENIARTSLGREDKATKCESAMGRDDTLARFGQLCGWQDCHKTMGNIEEEQRMVGKTVGMVVDVLSLEKEDTIAGRAYKRIPQRFISGCIADDLHFDYRIRLRGHGAR